MKKNFQVTRTDGNTGTKTNVGAATTGAKAIRLRDKTRMSARVTQPGNSNSYGITKL